MSAPEPNVDEIEQRLAMQLGRNAAALDDLKQLAQYCRSTLYEGGLWPHVRGYNRAIASVLGYACPAPPHLFHTSWGFESKHGAMHNELLAEVFVDFERDLLADLHAQNIEGCVIEFGVFEGFMLNKLLQKADEIGMQKDFYGFDSFEGLSEPSAHNDYDCWQKGQFYADYDSVARNLRLSERTNLHLVKGWLEDSLHTKEAQSIESVAYARIDVDIYEPTRDCLNFLGSRLADGSILLFDDWAYTSEKGESKAFFEWVPTVPHLRFEWLGSCGSRFYLKVLRKT